MASYGGARWKPLEFQDLRKLIPFGTGQVGQFEYTGHNLLVRCRRVQRGETDEYLLLTLKLNANLLG